MEFKKKHIDVISMGCSKNLVDSERLISRLAAKGYEVDLDPQQPHGEYAVINTCGFIGDAKEESINMILELAELKKAGTIGKIFVMGCLSERYREELKESIPEIDSIYGKFDWNGIIDEIPSVSSEYIIPKDWERKISTSPWSAYLKISEGCDRYCAFCAIPYITGRHTSRPIEEILDEARQLVGNGVKEINVIAQDLSSYGIDLYGEQRLAKLLEELCAIEGLEWIRLHYLYPSDFPLDILDVMNRQPKICKYLDIAFQHISDKVLANMNRKFTKKDTLELIKTIRRKVPGIHIRTTLMTGFPGEGEKEFEELIEFVEDAQFERLGAFSYSEEEGTLAASRFDDEIPEEEKKSRLEELMDIQQNIALESNRRKIGRKMKVLVERHEGINAIGRTEFDSPEVDPEVVVENCNASPGTFINVLITDAEEFDIIGRQE